MKTTNDQEAAKGMGKVLPTHYPLPGLPYRIALAVKGRPEAFDWIC